jgi:hypothetical protein
MEILLGARFTQQGQVHNHPFSPTSSNPRTPGGDGAVGRRVQNRFELVARGRIREKTMGPGFFRSTEPSAARPGMS